MKKILLFFGLIVLGMIVSNLANARDVTGDGCVFQIKEEKQF